MDEGVVTAPGTSSTDEPGARDNGTSAEYDIRLIGLTKRFDEVVAVDDVSLDIDRGQFFALLGPSGCGKTTTLRMIGGFEEPTEGRIELGGTDVAPLPPYKRDVNTVFQSYALFPHLSIFENVAFGLRRRGVKSGEVRRRVGEALELVGLAGLERRKPRQLSGGQQQRIALARALVNRPRVLLLDEPLGALDLKLRKEMQLELKRIQHEVEITFVHVTHDQEEAMTMADRIVIMNGGRIEQHGTPNELYERPRTAFVAGFLGASNLLEGTVAGDDRVKLADGTLVQVPRDALPNRTGDVQIGVRPEKLRIGAGEANSLSGSVTESAYIGVSTQYIVDTPAGPVTVYVQNDRPGGQVATGERLTLSWSPESTFVVDAQEGTQ
jgi:spermidine/putrescine transport system ATP-binding protein